MAKLYAKIQADKGIEITRTANHRLTANLSGWDKGWELIVDIDDDNRYAVILYQTGGSKSPAAKKIIHSYQE